MNEDGEIALERRGCLGLVTLSRPRALHALTAAMVRALSAALVRWREDPEVVAVLIRAAPGRAFCAGGDIRLVSELARERGVAAVIPFFADEYRLNWRIARLGKPYIALLDGITMGGGAGIAVHGTARIATENTAFAMPETGIGFFPDVGATYFLPRLPGEVGTWLGLTGARLGPADCMAAGITTHFVEAGRRDALIDALIVARSAADVTRILGAFATPARAGELEEVRARIDRDYAGTELGAIVARLGARPGAEEEAILRRKSPFALHATLAQLRRGRELDLEGALRLEYRMAHRFLAAPDFQEGVRALIIDKDRAPRWTPAGLDAVDPASVEAVFAPLDGADLAFHWDEGASLEG